MYKIDYSQMWSIEFDAWLRDLGFDPYNVSLDESKVLFKRYHIEKILELQEC